MKGFWDAIKAFFLGLFSEAKTTLTKVAHFVDATGRTIEGAALAASMKVGAEVKAVETSIVKVARLWDDKRTFGVIWALLALSLPFFMHPSFQTIVTCTVMAFILWMGVPLGDLVKFLPGLQSQGILDLVTNKANQGDPMRFFGIVLQVVAWVYLFAPLWGGGFDIGIFQFWSGAGVAMSLASIWGDHAAVKAAS